jgi:hypothetical protein
VVAKESLKVSLDTSEKLDAHLDWSRNETNLIWDAINRPPREHPRATG